VLTFSIADELSFQIGDFSLSTALGVLGYHFEAKSGLSRNQYNLSFNGKSMQKASATMISSFGVTTASQIQVKLIGNEEKKQKLVDSIKLKLKLEEDAKN